MFGQNLELSQQDHVFWDFNVREVSAYVHVQKKPFIQMLTLYVHT